MKDFFYGFALPFKGISFFYKERSLWKHTIGPWCILTAVYGVIIWLILHLTGKLSAYLSSCLTSCPAFLKALLSGTLTLAALIISSALVLTTLSTLFEIFGGLFFDRMLEDTDERYFHTIHPPLPFKQQLRFTCQGAWFGVKTTVLFIILAVAALFLPLVGQLCLIAIIGFRMGYSFLFAPGFLNGRTLEETTDRFRKQRAAVAGFGICAYLIQLIPFSMPFTLPGIVLGALMLYNGTAPDGSDVKR